MCTINIYIIFIFLLFTVIKEIFENSKARIYLLIGTAARAFPFRFSAFGTKSLAIFIAKELLGKTEIKLVAKLFVKVKHVTVKNDIFVNVIIYLFL